MKTINSNSQGLLPIRNMKLSLKWSVMIIMAIIFITATAWQRSTEQEKEKQAIIKLIEDETSAWCSNDFDKLAATYVDDPMNTRLTASNSGYTYLVGWENVGKNFMDYMAGVTSPSENKYVKNNYRIKVYKDSAWAIHDEVVYDKDGKITAKAVGVRFLEKVRNEWKIIYFSLVTTSSYTN